MPEIIECPCCGKEIDMSEDPIFCENCGGNLLDMKKMPEIMHCPRCGKKINMSKEPLLCENCGINITDMLAASNHDLVVSPPCLGVRNDLLDKMTESVDPISNEAEVVQSSAPEEFEKPSMSASKTYHYNR